MSSADAFDMGDGAAQAAPELLKQLRETADTVKQQYELVEQLEADLKAAKAELARLRTQVMPDLMAEVQMDKLSFESTEYELSDFMSGSLPKDPEKRQKAYDWLLANDGEGLLKADLSVAFGRSQFQEAKALFDELQQQRGLPAVLTRSVHTQSLLKWARDRVKDGKPIDYETLGLFSGKVVKIKEQEG